MQLELFRLLMTILISVAPPGTTGCNAPVQQATVCWIQYTDPDYLEYLTPARIVRLSRIVEMARAGVR